MGCPSVTRTRSMAAFAANAGFLPGAVNARELVLIVSQIIVGVEVGIGDPTGRMAATTVVRLQVRVLGVIPRAAYRNVGVGAAPTASTTNGKLYCVLSSSDVSSGSASSRPVMM